MQVSGSRDVMLSTMCFVAVVVGSGIPATVNVRYCARDIFKIRTLTHKHREERLISFNEIFYNGILYFDMDFFLFFWEFFSSILK